MVTRYCFRLLLLFMNIYFSPPSLFHHVVMKFFMHYKNTVFQYCIPATYTTSVRVKLLFKCSDIFDDVCSETKTLDLRCYLLIHSEHSVKTPIIWKRNADGFNFFSANAKVSSATQIPHDRFVVFTDRESPTMVRLTWVSAYWHNYRHTLKAKRVI